MKKAPVYLSLLICIFFWQKSYSQNFNHSESDIKEILSFLADDNLKGRAAGTKEDKKAAKYIAERLEEHGFKPVIGEKPLIPFNLILYRETGYGSSMTIDKKSLVEWRDFMIHPQSPSVEIRAILNNSVSVIKASYDSIPLLAAKHKSGGADAIMIFTGEELKEQRRGGITTLSLPVIQISEQLYSNIKSDSVSSLSIKTVTNQVSGTTYNVLMKYGKDNAPLKVMIGAHYDHLGMGGVASGSMKPRESAVHNGADDNASGVAAAIEIGRLLTSYADSLGVQVFVAAFGAEERGLIGSRSMADTLKKLDILPDIMINLDMVGRMTENKLQIGGVGTFAEAADIVDSVNTDKKFTITMTQDGYGPSDHSSFYTAGVPVLYFTTGVHKQYHTPEDDIEFINFEGIGRISEFISSLIADMSSKGVPKYIKTEAPTTMSRASFKVTLGVIPDFTYEKGDGFRVGSVSDGKPAQKGGMIAGDIIKVMNNKKISNIYEYMAMLSELKAGELLSIEVEREGAILKLEIQL
ncbi:MAG: hypothetical protein BGO30_07830 [Bacteroidetes bacterium 41-46]|nr:MAG: hypothetical protein BGO30_07830 [Bacteroidetes bacterium 41-46]